MASEDKTDGDRLSRAAANIRPALEEAGSDKLLELFDYLLAKSIAGESPSEQQIASEAFLGESAAGNSSNPNVRVRIHRLRKLLAAECDADSGDCLEIPVGDYCLRLAERDDTKGLPWMGDLIARFRSADARSRKVTIGIAVGVALVATLIVAALLNRNVEPLSGTVMWQSFDRSGRPVTIVFGDYYMFAELDAGEGASEGASGGGPRLVWDRTVPTREDLTIYQILNPANADGTVDFNQQFVSAGTIQAISNLRKTLARLPSSRYANVNLVAASQMTPEMLRDTDIIFVGQFSGMPVLLKDPLLRASSLTLSPQLDSLSEADGTERYRSDGMSLTDERIGRRDYAYLAAMPGPAGNRILMFVGLGEAGLREAGELLGDVQQLQELASTADKIEDGFEGVYRVRTIGEVNVNATLILDRPLDTESVWDDSGEVPLYRPIDPDAANVRE
ncbi:hypothetical protein [Aurantiacibacter rhizosphaerae]|uniref:Uncharacterized protein n=1 Tax=Aurantiacibacter rhizosphaerae TaxID=2691582 RepID=A0A844XAS6_9SPHN|nr:hypothetical protein [Aurantiacibacter rhizosphaerae]MWV26879.1 hypothetical protein [Aurantiacibacter rhizosphaerae]